MQKIDKNTIISFDIGLMIIILIFFIAIFANFISPYNPYQINQYSVLKPPSKEYIFGTDSVGRDVLSRCFYGVRTSFIIGLGAMAIASILGSFAGIFSGYYGGRIDRLFVLSMDALWALPGFITALLISVVLGQNLQNTILAIGITYIPSFYRVVRGVAIGLKEEDYIKAEITLGASNWYIILHHILPSAYSVILVILTMGVARSILIASGLGFLGLGIPPPVAELGSDLAQGRMVLLSGSWWTIAGPALFIFIIILGFNLLGESLSSVWGTSIKET
jgi:peptide/nickel transport system permease protein